MITNHAVRKYDNTWFSIPNDFQDVDYHEAEHLLMLNEFQHYLSRQIPLSDQRLLMMHKITHNHVELDMEERYITTRNHDPLTRRTVYMYIVYILRNQSLS